MFYDKMLINQTNERSLDMKTYKTIAALAKDIGVTRATVYRRSEKYGIDLRNLDIEGITDDEFNLLSTDVTGNVSNSTAKDRAKIQQLTSELERLNSENQRLIDERSELNTQHHEREQALLKSIDEAHALIDQAQRLQLSTQQALDDKTDKLKQIEQQADTEQPRGFWSRLFGK